MLCSVTLKLREGCTTTTKYRDLQHVLYSEIPITAFKENGTHSIKKGLHIISKKYQSDRQVAIQGYDPIG